MAVSPARTTTGVPGTNAACSQKQISDDSLPMIQADSGGCQEIQSLLGPAVMRVVAPVAESQSTCLTAGVEQLRGVSLTQSISSTLLTSVPHRGRSDGADVTLKKSRGDERAVKTTLTRLARASDPDLRAEPANPRVVSVADLSPEIAHLTPIAALQTERSPKSGIDTCRPHSRIPSSIKRPKPDVNESSPNITCVQHDFSFTEAVPQEAATPPGFGSHQMWDMGDFAVAAPKLQLSQAAAIETPNEHMPSKESMTENHEETVKETCASSVPLGDAISSLTPIANVDNLARSPPCTLSEEHNHKPERQSTGVSRPPAHPGLKYHAKAGTRIPSCRRKSRSQACDSVDHSTPAPLSKAENSSDPPNGHVKLILGSGEAACVSTPRPSADPELLRAKADEVPIIGTPPYNKLMKFLRNPNPAPVGDPLSALAQANSLQDIEVSPVMLSDQLRSSSSMMSGGQPENKPFRQLLQNIEANQYRSPAVNVAAFAGIVNFGDSTQPERNSPLMTHSEMGENSTDEGGFMELRTQEKVISHMCADRSISDDVCCSRVSALDPRAGAVSECSVGMGKTMPFSSGVGYLDSPISHCRPPSKFGLAASPEHIPAVAVSITHPEDETCQLKVFLNVRDEMQPSASESVASRNMSQHSAELGQMVAEDCPLLQQTPGAGICNSAAISGTVNIGECTPCSQKEAAELFSCVNAGIRNSIASVEGGDSPMHSVSITGGDDVVSPPQLCTSPDAAGSYQIMVGSAQHVGLRSPIKSLSPDLAGAF